MHVKVCGITQLEDARAAARLGVDYIGLIRAASARQVDLESARQIAAGLPATTRPVLLFRNAPLDEVCTAVEATGVGWLQLHGTEPVAYAGELRHRLPEINLIRAWEVSGVGAADELGAYLRASADNGVQFSAVILDAPKGGPHPGYECLGEVSRRCQNLGPQIWCAGGLTPENVATAVGAGSYQGVDVARGVEQSPGVKDHEAMGRFVAQAKAL